jgi:hypothetical protein
VTDTTNHGTDHTIDTQLKQRGEELGFGKSLFCVKSQNLCLNSLSEIVVKIFILRAKESNHCSKASNSNGDCHNLTQS